MKQFQNDNVRLYLKKKKLFLMEKFFVHNSETFKKLVRCLEGLCWRDVSAPDI